MLPVVLGAIGLVAVLSWIVAVIAAIQIVGLAPKGTKIRNYYRLGWWKFADIKTDIGPAADIHIRTYQRAFIAFFVCVLGLAVVMVFLGAAQQT
jgi:hypothetical protein